MPEVEFTIDTATGELQMHVQGVAGPACDDVARLVKDLAGEPGREEATAEYHLQHRWPLARPLDHRRAVPK
jgi:hypothetical protein